MKRTLKSNQWAARAWVAREWRDLERRHEVTVPPRYREKVLGWYTGEPAPESFRADAEDFILDNLPVLRAIPKIALADALPAPNKRRGERGPYYRCRLRAFGLLVFVAERTLTVGDILEGNWKRRVHDWRALAKERNRTDPTDRLSSPTLKNEYFRARKLKANRDACLIVLNEQLVKPVLARALALAHYYRERGEEKAQRDLAAALARGRRAFASVIELTLEHYSDAVGEQLARAGLVKLWGYQGPPRRPKRRSKDSLPATIRAAKACLADLDMVLGAPNPRTRGGAITAEVRDGIADYIADLEAQAQRAAGRRPARAPGRRKS
ncbi:MAG TPA: hypothetical protein VM221_12295 [Armatimonadota bacterium]|nr:hypothetical protein [Armatimonadota bacterium]